MSPATDQGRRPRGLDRRRLVALASALPVLFGLLLFVPAGTRAWGKGRLFVLIVLLSAIAAFLYIWRVNPEVAIARSRPQEGAKRWDRILVSFFLLRRSGPSSPWRPSTRIEDHLMKTISLVTLVFL